MREIQLLFFEGWRLCLEGRSCAAALKSLWNSVVAAITGIKSLKAKNWEIILQNSVTNSKSRTVKVEP